MDCGYGHYVRLMKEFHIVVDVFLGLEPGFQVRQGGVGWGGRCSWGGGVRCGGWGRRAGRAERATVRHPPSSAGRPFSLNPSP
jgi:hypothetical protein